MQVFLNGLISGLVLAVMALGFQSVYLPTRIFFMAQAGMYCLAPYVLFQARRAHLPWFTAIFVSFLAVIAITVLAEVLSHRHLARRGASFGAHFISSLGQSIILIQIIAMVWGNEVRVLRQGADVTFGFGETRLTRAQVIAALVSLLVIVAFLLWLKFSGFGLRLRALADNPTQLALFGYNIDHLRLVAFGISGGLTATASLVAAYDLGFDPHRGLQAMLLAMVAMIIGGRSSFAAPILGGLALGILRAETTWLFSAKWQDLITFGLMALFLLFRPQGILGKKMRLEAEGQA